MHRLYANEDITVFWNSEKCRHAKQCVTGCPKVFDITRKPWIDISQDENQKIWQAISNCPTGALTITFNHGIRVVFEESELRSAAYDGDVLIGMCQYEVTPDGWEIYHTEVNPEYGGKAIAKRLVYAVIERAEKSKAAVIPTCSYAAKVMQ